MDRPAFRVHKDWRGRFGVQAMWPKSGPWAKHQWWPRWVWHGPFGNEKKRWPSVDGAQAFVRVCEDTVAKVDTRP